MLISCALLFLLIGIFLAFYTNGKYVLPYIIFLNVYSAWVTDFVLPLEEDDCKLFDGISKYYTYFCFILYFITKRPRIKDYSLLLAFVLTAVYFVFIFTIRGIGPVVGLKFAVSTFGSVMFFFILLFIYPHKQQVRKLIQWNLIIQLGIGAFQFLGLLHFHMNVDETFVGTDLITGSFTRNNFYAEVVSLLMLLQCTFDYRDYGKLKRSSVILIILVLAVVFATGVRTALLADVIALVVMFFIINKNKTYFKARFFVGMVVLGIVAFSIYQTANQGILTKDREAGGTIERQLNGVREISDVDNMEVSTVGLTFILWQFFIDSPIIGPGLFYASSSGYGGIISEDTANSTDATILFYMCETGLIGVLCFLLIYMLALKRYNKFSGAYVIFLYIMLISITDPGFMGFTYIIYLYIIIFYDNCESYIVSNKILSHFFIRINAKET